MRVTDKTKIDERRIIKFIYKMWFCTIKKTVSFNSKWLNNTKRFKRKQFGIIFYSPKIFHVFASYGDCFLFILNYLIQVLQNVFLEPFVGELQMIPLRLQKHQFSGFHQSVQSKVLLETNKKKNCVEWTVER